MAQGCHRQQSIVSRWMPGRETLARVSRRVARLVADAPMRAERSSTSSLSCGLAGSPAALGKCRRPAGVTTRVSWPLQPDVGRITYGSGVCVVLPAVLRAGRLLLDRSHLTRPISIQLWTTSFPVYDDANPSDQARSSGFAPCRERTRLDARVLELVVADVHRVQRARVASRGVVGHLPCAAAVLSL